MEDQFERTRLLIGDTALQKIQHSKIVVFGVGGVGSYVVEALARAGIGHIVLVDPDTVDITNLNRQIEALHSTIGKLKVEVVKKRILDINPEAEVEIYKPNDIAGGEFNLIDKSFTYVVDAIDTMKNKIQIIEKAYKENVKIISATGAANKIQPSLFEVSDIYNTSVCPVCKILRKELKQRNIPSLKVVYSKEVPKKIKKEEKKLGSISFVPSVEGLIMAGEVIKDIIKEVSYGKV